MAQDEQALWQQFETRTQQADESVEAYADAIRRMAAQVHVCVHGGNIRAGFLKGLLHPKVRAKVDNLSYFLPPSFDELEAAAAHHEKLLRRDKPARPVGGEGTEKHQNLSPNSDNDTMQRLLADNRKGTDESLQRHILELKRELATQKQTVARMQLEKSRQTRPFGPCFTCNSPDHQKRTCPLELAKRGTVNPVSMAEIFEVDVAKVLSVEAVEEMIQRFQDFIADEEFTTSTARQVALVDLGEHDRFDFLSQAMAEVATEGDDIEDDPGAGPIDSAPDIRKEALHVMAIVRDRREKSLSTLMKDILGDIEGQAAMRRGMEAACRKKARDRLLELQRDNQQTSTPAVEGDGVFEYSVDAHILTRKLPVVVDTGASHSIVALRTIRKLRLKSLIRPSKKAFITAGGELSFPVGEIAALAVTMGGATIRVNCMVVNKACFSLLLGLDVMKPLGTVIDLQQDSFSFSDPVAKSRVQVPLMCTRVKKTLNDVKMASTIHCVNMFRPIPAHEGPLTG